MEKSFRDQIRALAGTYIRTGISTMLDHAENILRMSLGRELKISEVYLRSDKGNLFIDVKDQGRIPVRDKGEGINRIRYLSLLEESGIKYSDLIRRYAYDVKKEIGDEVITVGMERLRSFSNGRF